MNSDPNTPWWLQGGQESQPPSRPMPSSHNPYNGSGSLPSYSGTDGEYAPPSAPPPPRPRRSARSDRQPAPPNPPTPRRDRRWIAPVATVALALFLSFLVLSATSAHDNGSFFGLGGVQPTATRIGYARAAKITFTRTTQSITAPSTTLIAATDGSGQIKASVQTASVKGATSGVIQASFQDRTHVIFTLTITNNSSIQRNSGVGVVISDTSGNVTCTLGGANDVPVSPHDTAQQPCAEPYKPEPSTSWNYTDPSTGLIYTSIKDSPVGGNAAYYYVPTSCGDPSPAEAAARAALQSQLTLTPNTVLMHGPDYAPNVSSITCAPGAGTQQPTPFTYTQKIDATASQTVFTLADLQAYATRQLQTKLPQDYILSASQICPSGPQIGAGATATKATITCPATGTAAWNWTPDTLSQLARSLEGTSPDTAALQLNKTPGIVVGSVKILLIGGSELPQDPSVITFNFAP